MFIPFLHKRWTLLIEEGRNIRYRIEGNCLDRMLGYFINSFQRRGNPKSPWTIRLRSNASGREKVLASADFAANDLSYSSEFERWLGQNNYVPPTGPGKDPRVVDAATGERIPLSIHWGVGDYANALKAGLTKPANLLSVLHGIFPTEADEPPNAAKPAANEPPYWIDHAGRRRSMVHPLWDLELSQSPPTHGDQQEIPSPRVAAEPGENARRLHAGMYARAFNQLDPSKLPQYESHVTYRSAWTNEVHRGQAINAYIGGKIAKASERGPFSKGPLAAELALDSRNRHCVLMYQGNLEAPVAAVHFSLQDGQLSGIEMREVEIDVQGRGIFPA